MKQRIYNYRRNLPHIQKADRPHFITFVTYDRWILPAVARDIVLRHCLHDNGAKMRLFIAVVMPDHVHMIFTPLLASKDEPFTFAEILGGIKGASSHSVNKALSRSGHVWLDESFDHVLRSSEKLEDKIEYVRNNPVRKGLVSRPEDYPWLWEEKPCGTAAPGGDNLQNPEQPKAQDPQPRAAVPQAVPQAVPHQTKK